MSDDERALTPQQVLRAAADQASVKWGDKSRAVAFLLATAENWDEGEPLTSGFDFDVPWQSRWPAGASAPERCVHAVDGPDWAGLREPTSWKERAIAAEAENVRLTERLESSYETSDRYNARIGEVLEQAVINETRLLAERDSLQGRLDATEAVIAELKELERLSAGPDWPGWNALNSVWRIIRYAPGPWTVVPEGDGNV